MRNGLLLSGVLLCACGGSTTPEPQTVQPGVEPEPVAAGRVPPAGPYLPGFDVRHYDIVLTLPDTGTFIEGRTSIDIARTGEAGDTLRLDFVGLRALSVTVTPAGRSPEAAAFRQDDGRLFVALPRAATRASDLRVEVSYDGVPDDGLILRHNVHGAPSAFVDNWPDRARFWFPSVDHPSDKATVRYEVRAPAGFEVIANGRRSDGRTLGEPPADGVWRYEVAQPIPTYTMVIGATDFAIGVVDECAQGGRTETRTDGCVLVSSWTFPQDSANGARIFRRAGDMVRYYSERFGPFPYDDLAHVQSATRFGGMENVGAIFYSEQAIANGTLGEGTVAHETIHQWFGDAVTETRWSHLWLSEGFATYFGMQYFEEADGADRFHELLLESRQGYLDSDVTDLAMVDTLDVPQNDLFALLNANSYNKGGQVLHMLRALLGDSAFFDGLRRFYTRHVHGNAVSADLQRALEEASGQQLGWFFDQWVYSPGFPMVRTSWEWDAAAGEVAVTVEQTQKDTWPTFRLPFEIEFDTPGGKVRRTGEVTERRQVLRFALPGAPTGMRFDPDDVLLMRRVE